MIEKKLQDKIEDVAAVTLQENLEMTEPAAENPQPVPEAVQSEPEILVAPEDEPMQVAGIGGVAKKLLGERLKKAEEQSIPKLPDEPILQVGDEIIIRQVDPNEIKAIEEAFGGKYTKSLDFPAIMGNMEDFDVQEWMAKFKDANSELIELQRRGSIRIEDALAYAQQRDLGTLITSWLKRTPGEPANVEDFVAGMVALDGVATHTRSLMKQMDELDALEAMDEVQSADYAKLERQFLTLMTVQGRLAANVSGAVSEGARLPATAGVLKRQGLPDYARRAQELGSMIERGDFKDVRYLREAMMSLETKDAQIRFSNKILDAASLTYQTVNTIWMNSMLSAIPTHVVNMASNIGFQGLDLLETSVAIGIGKSRQAGAALTGRKLDPEDMRYASEAVAQVVGMYKGMMDGFMLAGKALKTGEPYDLATKLDMSRRRPIGDTRDYGVMLQQIRDGQRGPAMINFVASLYEAPGRFLMAGDEFFKAIGYRASLYKQAEFEAKKAKEVALRNGRSAEEANARAAEVRAKILDNPAGVESMTAQEASRELTMTSELTGIFRSLQTTFNYPILKQFLPFVTAPLNEFRNTYQRIPLIGFASPKMASDLMAGGRRADTALAKQTTAAGIAGLTVHMIGTGFGEGEKVVITGAGPRDQKARNAFERLGLQSYAIHIRDEELYEQSGGKQVVYRSYPYSRMGPMSGILAMAADFSYYSQYENDYGTNEALAHAYILSTAEYLIQMPYLQSLQDIMGAVRSDDAQQVVPAVLDKIAQSQGEYALSVVPGNSALGRSVIRGVYDDPTVYSSLIPDEGPFGTIPQELPEFTHPFFQALQRQAASNWIFNQREDLYPTLNIWGEERERGLPGFNQFWSPWRIKDSKWSQLDMELVRLGKGLPELPRQYRGVQLTDKQMHRWTILTNEIDSRRRVDGMSGYNRGAQTLKEKLLEKISSSSYLNKAEKDRDWALSQLSSVYNSYRELAWEQLKTEPGMERLQRLEDEAKKPTAMPKTMFSR